jgi:hypothetical protein
VMSVSETAKGLSAPLVRLAEPDGRPLGVCINDCEVDYGQPYAELIGTCFKLRCAFATMRWGDATASQLDATASQRDSTPACHGTGLGKSQ